MRPRFARRVTAFKRRLLKQSGRHGREEVGGLAEARRGYPGQDACDDGLDRAWGVHVELPATGGELEEDPPLIFGVTRPLDESAALEAIKDAGQRARVHAGGSRRGRQLRSRAAGQGPGARLAAGPVRPRVA